MPEKAVLMPEFVFLLLDGFTMQAFSSSVEVLRVANKLQPDTPIAFHAVSMDGDPVASSNGIRLMPDLALDDISRDQTIVVVAGAGAAAQDQAVLLAKLRWWARQGHRIWGVSSGVLHLVRSGLMDGRTVAAHWEDIPYIRDNHPNVQVALSLYVPDKRFATCAGGNAAADLMLQEIAGLHGMDFVDEINSRLLKDGVRDGRISQNLPANLRFVSSNVTVFGAIRLMGANLFDPLSIAEIARRLDISQRQLERLFLRELGRSPNRVYTELRLSQARQDVLAGNNSISNIALDYGFTIANFSKTYRRVFGALPSQDREEAQPKRSG